MSVDELLMTDSKPTDWYSMAWDAYDREPDKRLKRMMNTVIHFGPHGEKTCEAVAFAGLKSRLIGPSKHYINHTNTE